MKRRIIKSVLLVVASSTFVGFILTGCGGGSGSSFNPEGVWTLDKMAIGEHVSALSGMYASMMKSSGEDLGSFELKSDGTVIALDEEGNPRENLGYLWEQDGDRVILKLDPDKQPENVEEEDALTQKLLTEGLVFNMRDGQLWYDISDIMKKVQEGIEEEMGDLEGEAGELAAGLSSALSGVTSAMTEGEISFIYVKK